MSRLVELIHDADCPHVSAARTGLLKAFVKVGQPPKWSEWERRDPEAPDYVRGCGSPTILVDGRDVAPPPANSGEGCCRLYEAADHGFSGAPAVELIAAALMRRPSERRLFGLFAAAPGVLAAALPACPFCWPLYAGTLSAIGFGFLLDEQHMQTLAGVLLATTLAPLAYRARARRGWKPLLVGSIGAGAILLGKFIWVSGLLGYVGLALVLVATLWNILPGKSPHCPVCKTA